MAVNIQRCVGVSRIHPDLSVCLAQRRNAKHVLNQHHPDKNDRLRAGPSVIVAALWVKLFMRPFVIPITYHAGNEGVLEVLTS